MRQALRAVASSWLLTVLVTGWLLLSCFTMPEAGVWGWLRKLPVAGIGFDFMWCLMDFLEAQYKVTFLYSWLPGVLHDLKAAAPSWKTLLQWAHSARAFASR